MTPTVEAFVAQLPPKQRKLLRDNPRAKALLGIAQFAAENPRVRLPAQAFEDEGVTAAIELGRAVAPRPADPTADLAVAMNRLAAAIQAQKLPTIEVKPQVNIEIPQRAIRVERDQAGRVVGARPL